MKTFLEIFEENVRKFGSKTALKDTGSGTVLTYEELDRRSGQAAALFMQRTQWLSCFPAALTPWYL